MEKREVCFPISSSASASDVKFGVSSSIHVNMEASIKSKRKETSREKEITKHRYIFHTRSQIDILDDGYRWRKYGEKLVKNNKFPRCYYRCSYRGCGVKKQIQRHSKDEQVVVTTYEGKHIHPVNKSAESFDQILNDFRIYNHLYNASPILK